MAVLDRGQALYAIGETSLRALGATLWTDYAVTGDRRRSMLEAESAFEDHRLTARHDGSAFLPRDALEEHRRSRSWLAGKLAEAHDGTTHIVTHHVPHSTARNPKFGTTMLSPAFDSDCDDLIGAASNAGVSAWIFGHHHWCQALEVSGVRLVSAQLGYPGEETGWSGAGILRF